MVPGTRIAPGDEDTVALASGVTYWSRSPCTLESFASTGTSHRPAGGGSGRGE
jgi:hypothetical protein